MKNIIRLGFLSIFFYCNNSIASTIIWDKESATVWLYKQTISGEIKDSSSSFLTIHHDQNSFTVPVHNNRFTFNCNLHNQVNSIWAEATTNNTTVFSDTLRLTLGYKLLPVIKPFATVHVNKVLLHAS